MTTALTTTTTQAVNAGEYSVIAPAGTDDEKLVALWLASGKRANSSNTQAQYMRVWRQFRAAVATPLQQVTLPELIAWRDNLAGADSSKRLHVAAMRSLFAFGVESGYLRMSPAVMLDVPAVPDQLHTRHLEIEQLARLLTACETPTETALIRGLYSSGCRISELLALRWQDVKLRDNGGAVLHVVKGKGNKSRQAGINAAALAALQALKTEETKDTDFVFATKTGKAMDRVAAWRMVQRVAHRAKVTVSCHWLRHSHATHSLAAGAPVSDVQAQLGHSSLNTTTRYAHATAYSSDKLPL